MKLTKFPNKKKYFFSKNNKILHKLLDLIIILFITKIIINK